jgi:hypothetical protein
VLAEAPLKLLTPPAVANAPRILEAPSRHRYLISANGIFVQYRDRKQHVLDSIARDFVAQVVENPAQPGGRNNRSRWHAKLRRQLGYRRGGGHRCNEVRIRDGTGETCMPAQSSMVVFNVGVATTTVSSEITPRLDSLVPVQVQGLTSGVSAIATSFDYSCAVVNQALQCWGNNYAGQLGNNSTVISLVLLATLGGRVCSKVWT